MSKALYWIFAATMPGLLVCATAVADGRTDVNDIAESYVKLVLEIGLYDDVYVDAYFGPSEWKPPESERQDPFPAERLGGRARELIARLAKVDSRGFTALEKQRRMYLPHSAREGSVLFVDLHSVVEPKEYEEMGERFEEIEHKKFGANGFENAVNQVAAMEKTLGIYDLAQFTPKEA